MATKKISELEAINAAEDNDVLVIVDTSESTTNKITKGNLLIGAGHTIEMTLNENYQIVLVLKNAAGTALSTQTIDLPNENAVTNLAYNNGILTVTKQSGATSQINLTGLIEGLVTESDFNTFKETLQTTLEAINEKDAEQDEAIAENYKVINKLNEKLENQQKVIDQLPQVTGQGTEVTLENTIKAQFTKFDEEGNSTQETTEGRNMLDINKVSAVVKGTLNNGVITSDTSTEATTMNVAPYFPNIAVNEGDTIYFNCQVKLNSGSTGVFGNLNDGVNGGTKAILVPTLSTTYQKYQTSFTYTSNTNINKLLIQIKNLVGSVEIKDIMISKSSSNEFEKFSYGASPNPNYEQPIYSAGDNENLFDKSTVILNKYINNQGEEVANAGFYTSDYISVIPNTNIILSGNTIFTRYVASKGAFYDENKSFISYVNIEISDNIYTVPNNAKYYRTTVKPVDIDNIKVSKGTTASGYSPYGMGSINQKIQTRNLFKNLPNTLDNYSIVMNNDGKKITFKGTNSSSTFYPSFIFYADGSVATSQWHPTKQQIDKSKGYFTKTGIAYILSLLKSGTFSGSNPSFFIGKETTFTSSGIFANVDTYTTQIANNSEKVNFIAIGFTPSQQVDLTFKIQLEPGSTATPYVPHEEQDYSIFVQQPFRSIGDVRDLFFKNTVDSPYYDENLTLNGWYERHYFSKIEQLLDLVGPVAQGFYFIPPGIKKGAKLLSTHQQLGTKAESEEWQRFDGSQMKQLYPTAHNGVYINYKADTKQEQIDWWNSLNNILLYELEIPLDLPCTPEQVEQIENKPSTYKDFTIIQSEDATPAYLEVSGIRDINTMFDKVTNAIVSLGGNV